MAMLAFPQHSSLPSFHFFLQPFDEETNCSLGCECRSIKEKVSQGEGLILLSSDSHTPSGSRLVCTVCMVAYCQVKQS